MTARQAVLAVRGAARLYGSPLRGRWWVGAHGPNGATIAGGDTPRDAWENAAREEGIAPWWEPAPPPARGADCPACEAAWAAGGWLCAACEAQL